MIRGRGAGPGGPALPHAAGGARLAEQGIEVENDRHSHLLFAGLGLDSEPEEVERSHALLTKATGRAPSFYAPSLGAMDEKEAMAVLAQLG
jgi:peptidoglycan/xylan/chitin deacetylase (PgdA/CDA1 family)